MEAKASKHASKCEHACTRVRVRVCVRERVRARAAWLGGQERGLVFSVALIGALFRAPHSVSPFVKVGALTRVDFE